MSDLPIKSVVNGINQGDIKQINPADKNSGSSFETVINEAIGKVSQVQHDVESAVSELASGGDVTTAILAAEKADMTFQLMVEVRNKPIRTYEDIMKMSV
jgi:flagellar hook-basal body complex protein FliE